MKAPKVCAVAGCGHPFYAQGYCSTHYNRVRLYADPEGRRCLACGRGMRQGDNAACHPGCTPLVCVCPVPDDDGLECRTCRRPVPTAEFLASAAAGAARLAAGLGS